MMPSACPFAITSAADIADGCSRINSDLLGFVFVVLVFCAAMLGREICTGGAPRAIFSAGSWDRFATGAAATSSAGLRTLASVRAPTFVRCKRVSYHDRPGRLRPPNPEDAEHPLSLPQTLNLGSREH